MRRLAVATLLLAAAASLPSKAAQAETRTLTIYHIHTKENITVTFKRNGRYDEAGLAKLNHFLRDWRNDAEIKMDPRLFDVVWEIYQEVRATEPIQIISAYRSPATNAMLRQRSRGVARFSQHMLGRAMDFNIRGVSLEQVRNAGLRQQRGGVGFYPSSGAPFVHVDVGSVRHWPRLPPAALARVMNERPTAGLAARGRALLASRSAEVDETPAQAAPRGRGWFSRMFSRDNRDNDDADQDAARGPDRQPASRPVRTAAAVPLPPVRPGARVSSPARAAASSGRPSPAQVVQARGLWNAADAIAAADAPPPSAPKVPRLVWQVGPQPVAGLTDASAMTKRTPSPRLRPGLELAAAGPETTASLPPWPVAEREDRVPGELVLAYAASDPPEQNTRSVAPMGALRAPPAAAPARPLPAARRIPPAKRLGDNPWLRGVVMTPSVHDAMDVAVLGPLNFSALRPLMHKPAIAIANAFADAADFGLTSAAFSGSAIGVVPTVAFGRVRTSRN